MTSEEFSRRFETLLETAGAIAKMRDLVRTFAVQGRLTQQLTSDEPAEALISRIADSLSKKASSNPFMVDIEPTITDESEYELPAGWAWLPLAHLGIWATGCGFPKQFQGDLEGEFLFCKVSDMNLPGNETEIRRTNNSIDLGVMRKIRAKANPPGTVIFPKIGGAIATHKRRLVVSPTVIDNNCSGIQPIGLTESRWLLILLRSIDFTRYQSGTSVPAVSQASLDPIRVGLPPLAEQKRIVARVDELMALCDRLEAQQKERETRHAGLARASLSRFADLPTAANLTFLFHKSYTIPPADLRKSILTLATQGKLVPNAHVDRKTDIISMERLVGRKSLKNGLSLTPTQTESDFVCLPLSAMKGSTIDCSVGKPIALNADRAAPYLVKRGDIFIMRGNGSKERVGIAGMVRSSPANVLFPDLFIRVPLPAEKIDGDYFLIAWNSSVTRAALESLAKTTSGIWKINQGHISECEIPLPPLAEQRRIVAKVDQLMALVDELESQLVASRATAARLLDAIVGELTA